MSILLPRLGQGSVDLAVGPEGAFEEESAGSLAVVVEGVEEKEMTEGEKAEAEKEEGK